MRDDDVRVASVLTRTSELSDELSATVAELVSLLTRHHTEAEEEADDE